MLVLVAIFGLLATAVRAQTTPPPVDCDTAGPFIDSACTENADCNQGECAIVHSKCNMTLQQCDCSLGYWGETATRLCQTYPLEAVCTSDEQCQASVPDSECSGGTCSCAAGFSTATSRILEKFCTPIVAGTPCTPGTEGDAFCATGDVNGVMTCSVNDKCACPINEIFNTDDSTCYTRSDDAACAECVNSGGKCYLDGGVSKCVCPSTKYSSIDDPMVTGCDRGSALVGGICQEDGTVTCDDDNADCVHFGTMTKRYVCQCATGYIRGPEFGNPEKSVCHEELSSRQDANCAQCNVNEGQCYDIDGDEVHDVCKCPTSRSTSDTDDYATYCDTQHVNVTCDSDSMTVCYMPHNTAEFPQIGTALTDGTSLLFVKDKIHDKNCYLTSTTNGWCIDLEYGTFLSCDTSKHDLNEHTVSYTNWIILQRQPEKRTVNDMYMYTYCSYDSLVNAFTGHVAVEIGEPPAVAAEGELIQAGVKLSILDEFSNDASASGVILGQRVQLLANITDDKGVFHELKAEVCLASNLPDLSSPFSRTTLMMYDGCPEVNSLLDEELVFTEDLGNPSVARTNMFSMFKFDDSEYVFFHCALRVCMDGNLEECDPSDCSGGGRRKRSAGGLMKRGEMVDQRKMNSAIKKLDNPDFTVSVSAVKIKREVNPNQIESDQQEQNYGQTGLGRGDTSPQSGMLVQFDSTTLIMAGGGLFGFIVLAIIVSVTVLVLKKSSRNSPVDIEAQNTHL